MAKSVARWHAVRCVGESASSSSSGSSFEKRHAELFPLPLPAVTVRFGCAASCLVQVWIRQRAGALRPQGRLVADTK
jgi:hypothetical protein